jgi:glycosyltransferase involved in cell wall biosynthesis
MYGNDSVITILIPTFNRCKLLEFILPSYFSQKFVKEVIIVNDASTDDTKEMIIQLSGKSHIPLRLINNPHRKGQQSCRHIAVSKAETDYVLFGEDDVWLNPDYCQVLLSEMKESSADMIAGKLIDKAVGVNINVSDFVDSQEKAVQEICDMNNFIGCFNVCSGRVITVPFLHTVALIKKSVFKRIGFDPWYKGGAQREETDFYISANSLGCKVCFSPNTACFHLRGKLSVSGGNRISRVAVEYYLFVNTWHMLAKHWQYLKRSYNFKGPVIFWMIRYFLRRQHNQFKRIISGDFISSFKKKI